MKKAKYTVKATTQFKKEYKLEMMTGRDGVPSFLNTIIIMRHKTCANTTQKRQYCHSIL